MNIAIRHPREIRAQHEINEIRFELGLSQAAFGELLGVSQKTISNWEIGSKSPMFRRGSLLYIWFRGPIKAARIAERIMQVAFSE
ncbi:MAG: helix-turn-helix domain-containing protein [Anaerolineales bacterium]|nr:MAG: helix-turn-helix domain-containing protein [Anaerolineales bacterium]